jgi:Chromate resistance exported protein
MLVIIMTNAQYQDTLTIRRSPMNWITRERPKIDRIACPWLILRFIDAQATNPTPGRPPVTHWLPRFLA